MALLFVMKDIRDRNYPDMPILCAHMNHGIREEAGEDEKTVSEYCEKLGIKLLVKHVDIPKIAEEEGLSLETAGRLQRYEFFRSVSGDEGVIAVAHHQEDQAESIAMHIFRGCGMEGLCGIRPKNGNIIHPFLPLHKKDIVDFCVSNGIPFCNDVTNADITYDRNFWRSEIFPSIEKGTGRNPVAALTGLSERVSEENDFLEALARQALHSMNESGSCESFCAKSTEAGISASGPVTGGALGEPAVPLEKLTEMPRVLRRRVLRLLALETYGDVVDIEAVHWDAILELTEKTSGSAYVDLPGGRRAAREAGRILYLTKDSAFDAEKGGFVEGAGVCVPEEKAAEEMRLSDLPIGEIVNFCQSFVRMRLRFVEKEAEVVYNNLTWFFPESALKDAVIRTRRQGDRLCRAGNAVTKELRRFMSEMRIPARFRDQLLLVARGNDVLWLPAFGHAVGFTDEESFAKYRETAGDSGAMPEDAMAGTQGKSGNPEEQCFSSRGMYCLEFLIDGEK